MKCLVEGSGPGVGHPRSEALAKGGVADQRAGVSQEARDDLATEPSESPACAEGSADQPGLLRAQ